MTHGKTLPADSTGRYCTRMLWHNGTPTTPYGERIPRWLHYFRVGNGCIILESATAALFYLAFVVTIASEDRHICGFWVEGGRMPGILGGLILKLPDNVTLTQAFTARKTNRPVIGFFHRVSLKYVLAST